MSEDAPKVWVVVRRYEPTEYAQWLFKPPALERLRTPTVRSLHGSYESVERLVESSTAELGPVTVEREDKTGRPVEWRFRDQQLGDAIFEAVTRTIEE